MIRLLFIGDSITDCDRERPIGERIFDHSLGNGYVSLVQAMLAVDYPNQPVHVMNLGISGNTSRDLKSRWQRDVLDNQPSHVAIFIGINDVWEQFSRPYQPDYHIAIDEYEQTISGLVRLTLDHSITVILMTPYFIETNRADPMRQKMDLYGFAIKRIATAYNVPVIDTQQAFDTMLNHAHPMRLAEDRVHPNLAGHLILAKAFLEMFTRSFD